MRNSLLFLLITTLLFSCSYKKQLLYIDNIKVGDLHKINNNNISYINIGDILKISIKTSVAEVSEPFNNVDKYKQSQGLDMMILDGYIVEKDSTINYPVLGKIKVVGFKIDELVSELRRLLIESGNLTNPYVKVNKLNFKFTVLGEVQIPGTYSFYDNELNIFQALGYAGDLLITAKRKKVKLIRQENGLRKVYKFSLNNSEIFDKPYYFIKSNDIIIIEPNFSKIKSAGFIGSPASITSLTSLFLSITLLLINN